MQYLAALSKEVLRRGTGRGWSVARWNPAAAQSAPGAMGTSTAPFPRSLHFDVEDNSQVDHVFKKMNRKLNMEGILLEARIRTWHTKKSDQKIIDQRRTAKRLARKAIGRKINWIMKRRDRGF
ncbi:ribosomal protein S21 [Chloropicon primus]|uniref:Ribosomal protein S21 n=1 Tax=Chloropicon primus TaxID=1764295 RepID=A0A5B8MKK0_9CHLO|nr:ribosomal protein S21 [Chloropicon primus]UPR00004.1 ribosomal protein S21 [Chloropicon primus]|mmetsp:Transcript_18161/g.37511  ORF Transcript_18161/g.37511 Transcript_18161/m.37511 type:complete len:123 (-) Transcript_18161:363-731(-)|eukprot:QDZ20791.1 ribosomal protein S21 [Chloropicon primus]